MVRVSGTCAIATGVPTVTDAGCRVRPARMPATTVGLMVNRAVT